MAQPSLLSRVINPFVDFLKTVPETIRDGFAEVANTISPSRKRRRISDPPPYSSIPSPHFSLPSSTAPENFSIPRPQSKRLRLSDSSATNAAGSSVPTPAAFRPPSDLLAAATAPPHSSPHILSRDDFSNHRNHSVPTTPYAATPYAATPSFDSPFARRPSLRPTPVPSTVDLHSVFKYPLSARRSSLAGLRNIWPPSRTSAAHTHAPMWSHRKSIDEAAYWEKIQERYRSLGSAPSRISKPMSSQFGSEKKRAAPSLQTQPKRPVSLSPYSASHLQPPSRDPLTTAVRSSQLRHAARATRLPPRPVLKKKRCYSEQRLRRSHDASSKKLSAIKVPNVVTEMPFEKENASEPLERRPPNATALRGPVPTAFIELLESDTMFSRNLLRHHGSTMARLAKSEIRSRHRQLERWFAELALQQLQRTREETQRLGKMGSQSWKRDETTPEEPPSDDKITEVNYWDEEKDDWDWEEEMDDVALSERENQVTVADENFAYANLTQSALKRLHATLADESNLHERLANIKGCIIRGKDLRLLQPNCWLNDEIVNSYMELLMSRMARKKAENKKPSRFSNASVPNVKIMSSFLYSKMVQKNKEQKTMEYNFARVQRWTRKSDVFSYDVLLVPINQQNLHWTLGVIDLKEKKVEHLDSMGTGGSPAVREHLLCWVRDAAEDIQKEFKLSEWKCYERSVPIQENTDDCGVFLCKYADFLCRGWKDFSFSQKHMNYFRARMAHELLMGRA